MNQLRVPRQALPSQIFTQTCSHLFGIRHFQLKQQKLSPICFASLGPILPNSQRMLVQYGADLLKELTSRNWRNHMISLSPVAVAVGVSYQLCIGLEAEIQMSVLRSFAQMLLLGIFLKVVYEGPVIWTILGVVTMVLLAGWTAGEQAKELPKSRIVATTALLLGTLGTVAVLVMLRVFSADRGYVFVVTGHMLGNAMIMVGRTLKTLQYEIVQHTEQIEAALALGASPRLAIHSYIERAFQIGMAPMIDAIKVMGLVSLPGNMTGLIMGGAVPYEAVKTQIKLTNALLGAAAVSCLIAIVMGWHTLFTPTCQLQDM